MICLAKLEKNTKIKNSLCKRFIVKVLFPRMKELTFHHVWEGVTSDILPTLDCLSFIRLLDINDLVTFKQYLSKKEQSRKE